MNIDNQFISFLNEDDSLEDPFALGSERIMRDVMLDHQNFVKRSFSKISFDQSRNDIFTINQSIQEKEQRDI